MMKPRRLLQTMSTHSLKLLLFVGFLGFNSSARADYSTIFSTPPYAVDQTILDVDGWSPRLPAEKGNPDSARVVAVRWADNKPALMLKGANLRNSFPPTTGEKVKITLDLALTFPDLSGSLRQFRIGFTGAPCGEIFMDLGAEGGLGYQADGSGRGGMVVLKKSEVKVNSFYKFTFDIDNSKRTYNVRVDGQKKDGTPFHHQAADIAFESKAKGVNSVYILSGGALTAYLRSLAVTSE